MGGITHSTGIDELVLDACYDEVTLVKQAVAGDADAFGALYLQHLDAIYRYVYFRVGDAEDAEDLTEQAFLKAWKALPGYKPDGARFSSWLYRIAHNAVVDHHRRRRDEVPLPPSEGNGGTLGAEWESRQPTALEQVIRAEEAQELASAMARLPEEYQELIILRFVEGLRHAEVARIIGKSENACRVIQHRALEALNHMLTTTREPE